MIEGDVNCTRCNLHQTAQSVCIMGKGPSPCDIMIIGEAPGYKEDETGKPFQGKAGKILDQILEECDVNRRNLYISNAVKCRPPQNSTPKKKEIGACSKWLMEEIDKVKPKFILLLGNTAATSVLGNTYPKIKMGEIRGRFFEVGGINIFATYHPSVAVRGISKYTTTMTSDIKRFFQVAKGGKVPKEEGINLTIVNSTEAFDEFMDRLEKEKIVSFDIESTGLNPRLQKVVCLGFGLEDEQVVIPLNHKKGWLYGQPEAQKEFCQVIEEVLEGVTLVAHNGKFDSGWMKVKYGVDFSIDHDTMLMSHLLDENTGNGLKYLAEKEFGAQNYDISLEEKTGTVNLETLAKYNGLDVYYTRKLYLKYRAEMDKDPSLLRFYENVVMPASRYFRDVEVHGVYINMDKLDEVETHLNKQVAELKAELDLLKSGVNWNSTKQVAEFLFKDLRLSPLEKTATGAFSTSESVMVRLARDHPAPKKILDLRAASKMLSTFVTSWKAKAIDSRLHPSFKLHGTVTGRLCLSGDTPIMTPQGHTMIQDIKPGDLVYCYDDNQNLTLTKVKWAGCTGLKPVYKLSWYWGKRNTGPGGFLIATGNHPIRISTGEYIPLEELKKGQSLMALKRLEGHKMGYNHLKIFGDSVRSRAEHRVIYNIISGDNPQEVHHIDGNISNNDPKNLRGLSKSEHIKEHQTYEEASRRAKLGHEKHGEYMVKRTIEARKAWSKNYLSIEDAIEAYNKFEGYDHRSERAAESLGVSRKCLNYRLADAGIGNFKKREDRVRKNNHKVRSVEKLPGLHEVYDIEVEEYHNFIANEICVHNSCSEPNLQQVPRDPVIRSLISAPPGWTLAEFDFSQVELRVAAILSGDKEMQRAFIDGEDIHTKTARMTTGEEPPTDKHELKEWRKKAKAVNFGFLYGMGAKKFQEYARDKYEVNFTMDECQNIRKRFFKTYSSLNSWYERQYRVAKLNGSVRSLTGRLRHLPDIYSEDDFLRSSAERQAVNSVVQGFASDMTVMSLIEIMETYSEETLNIIGTVHDAILMEIKTEKIDEVVPGIKAIMESPALLKTLGISLPIPIRADEAIGDWGNGVEWKPKENN